VPPPNSQTASTTVSWTFPNHAHVLAVIHANPRRILREVAIDVGITERAVHRIIQDLEDDGFIRRQRERRQNVYQILQGKPLRHPIEAHRTIGDLLNLITPNLQDKDEKN